MKECEKIRLIRKTLGYTQQELADILNVSKQYLSKVENGTTNLSKEKITFFCERFSVSSDWLLLDKGEMFIDNKTKYDVMEDYMENFSAEKMHLELYSEYIFLAGAAISAKYFPVLNEDVATVATKVFLDDYTANPHDSDYWHNALKIFREEKCGLFEFSNRFLKEYEKQFK